MTNPQHVRQLSSTKRIRCGLLCVVAAAATLFAVPVARAGLLTYTLSGSSITGNLGATNFTDASWSMSMTADSTTVVSGTYNVGPGGIYQFPYFFIAGTPVVTVNTGSSILTATLVPATLGNSVGLLSLQNPFSPTTITNQFQEWNAANTSPPNPSLGIYSSALNTLAVVGSFGSNQYGNASADFSTDQGTLHMSRRTDLTGSFIIAAAPVPEIDPAGVGSVLALVTGALGLIERRRLKAKVA
jgi:hypothetical protein